jgi:hypothetical protein
MSSKAKFISYDSPFNSQVKKRKYTLLTRLGRGRMYLGVVEMGGELHENGRDEGRHIVGESLHKGAEAEHPRVVLQGQVLTHTHK